MSDREALAIPGFSDTLDDFAPRSGAGEGGQSPHPSPSRSTGHSPSLSHAETRRSVDSVSQFPSREPARDAQLNLKGPKHVLDRFRAMCKADRRAYYDMLEILMDRFEQS